MVRRVRPKSSNIYTTPRKRRRSPRLRPDLNSFADCPELQDVPVICQKVKESLAEYFTTSTSNVLATAEPIKTLERQNSSSLADGDDDSPVFTFGDEEPPFPADCLLTTLGGGEEEVLPRMESSDTWLQPGKVFSFDGPVGLVGIYNVQKHTYDITYP